jgi:hypothetical protein
MPPYKEQFPVGTQVRIKDRAFLERFKAEWKVHHPLSLEQLSAAGRVDNVRGASFYHGGDVLYVLEETPGTWHEECLEPGNWA